MDMTVGCEATTNPRTCEKFLCSRQRPPFWFFHDDVLIGCRISFVTTSSSEIEVCFFFAVRIGPSVVGDVLAAAVSLCQTCPFGNNRYKMLVRKVFAKQNPSKLSDLPHI